VRRRATLLIAALCAACSSAPPPAPPPAPQAQAQTRLNESEARAAALVRAGDFAGAAREYGEAIRLAASVENADALAANAINQSIVDQWLGRDAEAREAIARVTDDKQRNFPEKRRLQAEVRRAILELAGSHNDAAATWAGRAETRCAGACEHAATILNVQAQIALATSHPADAERLAAAAGERASARGDKAEQANALRTLGRAQRLQGNAAAALPNLEQALLIDRELGDPRKILADLTELAMANDAAGNRDAARNYYARAVAVSKAMNDTRGLAEMEAQVKRP